MGRHELLPSTALVELLADFDVSDAAARAALSRLVARIDVVWPGKAAELMLKPGALDDASVRNIHHALAPAFPTA